MPSFPVAPYANNPNRGRDFTGLGVGPYPNALGPAGGDPSPSPAFWGSENPLVFGAPVGVLANAAFPAVAGVVSRAVWQSPPFDLRPDLYQTSNYRSEAQKLAYDSRLVLTIRHGTGVFLSAIAATLEVYSIEAAHNMDPRQARFIETPQEITTDFFDGTESVLLEWAPAGPPIRYWRVTLVFDWTDAVAAAPPLLVLPSAH